MGIVNLAIQILDKSHPTLTRVAIDQQGLSIGRDWGNDIVLQDQFVDRQHLHLSLRRDENGVQLLLEDRGSINGTRVAGRPLLGEPTPYQFGQIIKLGDSKLRIFDADSPVPDASPMSLWSRAKPMLSSPIVLICLTLLTLAAIYFEGYSTSQQPFRFSQAYSLLSQSVIVIFVWTLIIALISKAARGETNVRVHWALVCVFLLLSTLVDMLLRLMAFNLQMPFLTDITASLFYGALIGFACIGILSYATYLDGRTKVAFAVLALVGFTLHSYSDHLFKAPHERWTAFTQNETTTLPPMFLLRSPVDIEEYHEQLDALFTVEPSE